jgi:hypothetical protein
MVVPLDFGNDYGNGESVERATLRGECSERLTLDEFRMRLRKTLDFLRENERPNWQTVVAEHQKFLESLERRPQ